MHERSLVKSLIRQVEQILADQGGDAVEEVAVEVGPLSGVEPLLIQEAFSDLIQKSRATGAHLSIREVPITAYCQTCDSTLEIEKFHFRCPDCQSHDIRVTGGDVFRLLHVTLRQNSEPVLS